MKLYTQTPLKPLLRINNECGKNFQVKMECYQPDGSFKIRGISKYCQELQAQGVKKLVSASGGNAGHATAHCARLLGMDCTVVIPGSASSYMADVIRREGAEVISCGSIFDDANAMAMEIAAKEPNAHFVHPFDHPTIWNGHSTIVDELVEQTDKPDAIVLSVGGGGLLNGVIEGLDRNGWGDVPVIGVEVEGAPKFRKALEVGHPVYLDHLDTLANTLAGKVISQQSVDYAKTHNITSYLVSDAQAANGVLQFIEDFHVIVELACGASMSLAYEQPEIIKPYQNVVIIACGGAGVNLPLLLKYKEIFGL